jgi:ketopantoate reductase
VERSAAKTKLQPVQAQRAEIADSAGHLIVVGDGAVGTAVAVALSSCFGKVTLAGPPGTPEKMRVFATEGKLNRSAELLHTSIDRIHSRGIVVAALKAFTIAAASPFLKEIHEGSIICLSNGMGLDEEWGLSAEEVEYAVLSMGFRRIGPGTVLVEDGAVFCQAGKKASDVFMPSGMNVIEVENISDTRWAKWYANSIINPLGGLFGLENNKLVEAGLRPLIEKLSLEVSELMPSENAQTLGRAMLEWLLANSPNRCSMLQDILNGLPTEIDFLTGLCVRKLPGKCPVSARLVEAVKHAYRSGTISDAVCL